MRRFFPIFAVICLLLTGCLAVMGRKPTPEEVDALMRGEKLPARDGAKNQPAEPKDGNKDGPIDPHKQPVAPKEPEPTAQAAGPERGTVLRWMDCATLTLDTGSKLEVVRLAGVTVPKDSLAAETARMNAEDKFPSGTKIKLTYPNRDKAGNVIYRDEDQRLLANIEAAN